MKNLSLIDRPEVIAGLEGFDIAIAAGATLVPLVVLAVVNFYFFTLWPLACILMALWLREKKREKKFGYFQRVIYGFLLKKRIYYIKKG